MKRFMYFLLVIVFLTSCTGSERNEEWESWRADNGKTKVLATTGMIADLVNAVGGDYVDTLTLIKRGLDPHSYQLVKGDDERLAYAHVVFFNGLGLEHGPSLQQQLYGNKKAIGLGNKIRQKNPEVILNDKNQPDPHIWMDLSIWSKAIPEIVKALSLQDPEHALEYLKNGQEFSHKLMDVHQQIHELMAAIPEENRFLVTSHDAFNYFAKAYLSTQLEVENNGWRKRFAAPEGLAPESQLSARNIQEIIDHLKAYNIHVIFPESNVNKDSIRKIVQAGKEKGLDIYIADVCLYADAMGEKGSDQDTYIKMMRYNALEIARFLSGEKGRGKK